MLRFFISETLCIVVAIFQIGDAFVAILQIGDTFVAIFQIGDTVAKPMMDGFSKNKVLTTGSDCGQYETIEESYERWKDAGVPVEAV